jgi:N6-adenosine-specific RNA methylase IME4
MAAHAQPLRSLWTSDTARNITSKVDPLLLSHSVVATTNKQATPVAVPIVHRLPKDATPHQPLRTRPFGGQSRNNARECTTAMSVVAAAAAAAAVGVVRCPSKAKPTSVTLQRPGRAPRGAQPGSDSDEEFVEGTLRTLARASPTSKRRKLAANTAPIAGVSIAEKPAKGKQRALMGRRGVWVPQTAVADADAMGDGVDRLTTVIKLDRDRLPGWAPRPVRPYVPSNAKLYGNAELRTYSSALNAGTLLQVPRLLDFDFASLQNHKFIGVVVNAALAAAPPAQNNPAGQQSLDLILNAATSALTIPQLASLPLSDCLAPDALVCVWACKSAIGAVVQCMSTCWGAKYVENLTWVQLDPGGQVSKESSPYVGQGHLTLVMGRRGSSGELELRHQRTPDVLIAPALGNGRTPDAVREMLETLLPVQKRDEGDGDGHSAPRLLEVAFHGAEVGVRPDWVMVAQQGVH